MFNEQRIRAILFYLSVLVFFLGLPFILSFALGYKFDQRTLKFTKTGLLVLKTQPAGASVYLDEKLWYSKTPATVTELLPGRYHLRLELERHYPWFNEVDVEAGKVTRLERIILFPLRSNIKQLNAERLSSFLVDEERSEVYYINPEDNGVFKSDLEGRNPERIAEFVPLEPAAIKWKLSSDRKKLMYFNARAIGITSLKQQDNSVLQEPFILNYQEDKIIDVFWHSDSYHLILVGSKKIEALETESGALPVSLVNLNKRNTVCSYDTHSDTLYFLDSQKAADGNLYDNLYKLELNARTFPLQDLIKLKTNE
jgi:hypothetical protein